MDKVKSRQSSQCSKAQKSKFWSDFVCGDLAKNVEARELVKVKMDCERQFVRFTDLDRISSIYCDVKKQNDDRNLNSDEKCRKDNVKKILADLAKNGLLKKINAGKDWETGQAAKEYKEYLKYEVLDGQLWKELSKKYSVQQRGDTRRDIAETSSDTGIETNKRDEQLSNEAPRNLSGSEQSSDTRDVLQSNVLPSNDEMCDISERDVPSYLLPFDLLNIDEANENFLGSERSLNTGDSAQFGLLDINENALPDSSQQAVIVPKLEGPFQLDAPTSNETSNNNQRAMDVPEDNQMIMNIVPSTCPIKGGCSFVITTNQVLLEGNYYINFGDYGIGEAFGSGRDHFLLGLGSIPAATTRGTHHVTVMVSSETLGNVGECLLMYEDEYGDIANIVFEVARNNPGGADADTSTNSASNGTTYRKRAKKRLRTRPIDIPLLVYLCDEMAERGDEHFFRALNKIGVIGKVLDKRCKDLAKIAREHGHCEFAATIETSPREPFNSHAIETFTIGSLLDAVRIERLLPNSDSDSDTDSNSCSSGYRGDCDSEDLTEEKRSDNGVIIEQGKPVKVVNEKEKSVDEVINGETKPVADSSDNNYGATATVLDTNELPDIQHESTDNVDCLNSNNESCIENKIVSKEQLLFEHSYADGNKNECATNSYKNATPVVDETERKGSRSKAYQNLEKRCKDMAVIARVNDHCEFDVTNKTSPRKPFNDHSMETLTSGNLLDCGCKERLLPNSDSDFNNDSNSCSNGCKGDCDCDCDYEDDPSAIPKENKSNADAVNGNCNLESDGEDSYLNEEKRLENGVIIEQGKPVEVANEQEKSIDAVINEAMPVAGDHVISSVEFAKAKDLYTAYAKVFESLNSGKEMIHLHNSAVSVEDSSQLNIHPGVSVVDSSLLSNVVGILGQREESTSRKDEKGIIVSIDRANSLETTNYHLYLTSQAQVVEVSPNRLILSSPLKPLEEIKNYVINQIVVSEPVQLGTHCRRFFKGKKCGFYESTTCQLKHLEADPSRRTTLADRMIGKGNKFSCYVSAFACRRGGHIYYGIDVNSVVKGELMSNDKGKIIKNVEKAINKMIWPDHIGQPKRGQQWEIFFEPVIDENSKPVPSTFVIVIYIASCQGGVFTEEPECFEMVNGKVRKMSFDTWKKGILQPVWFRGNEKVPHSVSRVTWSSAAARKAFTDVSEKLGKLINNGDWDVLLRACQSPPKDKETKLLVLSKQVTACYRRGHFHNACSLLEEYMAILPKVQDVLFFEVVGLHIKAALKRATGDFRGLREALTAALSKAELIEPGPETAAVYGFAATVGDMINLEDEFSPHVLAIKCLEHLQHVEDSPHFCADKTLKAHIILSTFYLGCNISGQLINDNIVASDVKKAKSSIMELHSSTWYGSPLSKYGEVQLELIESIYRYRLSQISPSNRISLLQSSFDSAKDAESIAREHEFTEMVEWIYFYLRSCLTLIP